MPTDDEPRCACGQPRLKGFSTCGWRCCTEAAIRACATIRVGTLAVAAMRTGVCDVGERGVCYEVYQLAVDGRTRPGYSFIFERGCFDGFSPDEVVGMLFVLPATCPALYAYRFTSVLRLEDDFRRGLFAPAFAAVERSR